MVKVQKPINETEAIIREVWNTDNIESKTELNESQIEAINKLLTSSYIFASPLLRSHVVTFMKLQKSKNRQSMAEFVDALKSKMSENIEKRSFHLMG